MADRSELSPSKLLLGFELSRRVLDAPDDDSAEEFILEAAVKLSRADRAYLSSIDRQGEVEITRSSDGSLPVGGEKKDVLSACRSALERHRKRFETPEDVGTPARRPPETDESEPLSIVAKVLPDRERVLGFVTIVREARATFDLFERRCFSIICHHASSGLARRKPASAASAPAPLVAAAPRPETRRLTREEVAGLAARFPEIVGRGAAHRKLLEEIVLFGPMKIPVLLRGESGTGKELIARALHRASGRAGSFVAVNMGALPEGTVESELFGHEKGAFTGAVTAQEGLFRLAEGGTIFLDEIGEATLATQAKLLRVLESGSVRPVGGKEEIPVSFAVVAATHRPLEQLVKEGKFREDLYFRLRGVEIALPPLRERKEDLRALVDHIIREAKLERAPALSPPAWALLERHPFPGNVRELKRAIERALAFGRDPILPEHLGLDLGASSERQTIDEAVRKRRFREVYDSVGGNIAHAARILNVHRNTVARVLGLWNAV